MTTYSVSLTLSITAENELEARAQFYREIKNCNFDGDSVDVENEEELFSPSDLDFEEDIKS
jgi:hypothetical protein